MTEIAKAYVQLIPTTKGIGSQIESSLGGEMAGAGSSAGNSWSEKFISTAKKAIAAAGIGKVIKEAISAGADYQQNVGGIETLFGAGGAKSVEEYAEQVGKTVSEVSAEYETLHAAEERMMTYANEAYSSAGLSANGYMETVTGFAASLKQSVGGDMEELTSVANMAVVDMADNANKMGTDMESIQNAYQGFAKQNYTMLDNLKLGYGGTKGEMQRLLEDAGKISGIEYNIDNLSDVYKAVHVIQGELGITGTTAKEASETFSGSFASMKAAATNLLTTWASGGDVQASFQQLMVSVHTFVEGNLVPMLGTILSSVPQLVESLSGSLIGYFNIAASNSAELISFGVDLVSNLISGIVSSAPSFLTSALEMLATFAEGLLTYDWAGAAGDMIANIKDSISLFAGEYLGIEGGAGEIVSTIVDGIAAKASDLMSKGSELLSQIISGISEALPDVLSTASEIVSSLVSGITEKLPELASSATDIYLQIKSVLSENLPALTSTGLEILSTIISGITDNLPTLRTSATEIISQLLSNLISEASTLISAAPEMISQIAAGITANLPVITQSALELITQLIGDITANAPQLLSSAVEIINSIVSGITDNLPTLVTSATDIITGLLNALIENAPTLIPAAVELIAQLVVGIGQAIWNLGAAAIDIISNLKTYIVDNAESIKESGKEILSGIKEGILNAVSNLGPAALEVVTSFGNFIKEKASSLLDAGKSLISNLFGGGDEEGEGSEAGEGAVASFISGVVDKAGDAIASGVEIAGNVVSGVESKARELASSAASAIGNFIDGFGGNTADVTEAGAELITSAIDGITQNSENIVSSAALVVTNLAAGMAATMEPVKEAGKSLLTTFLDSITLVSDSVTASAESVMTNYITGLQNEYESVAACGREIVDRLKSGIEARNGEMIRVGENLIIGLWNGISNKEDWIKSQISGFADRVIDHLKSEFGINSPSKVTQWMGEMLAEGMAKGLSDNAYRVTKAWDRIASGITPVTASADISAEAGITGASGGGVQIVQNINAVPQTPVELASATLAYFQMARFAL